jgi:hypothetical protein
MNFLCRCNSAFIKAINAERNIIADVASDSSASGESNHASLTTHISLAVSLA